MSALALLVLLLLVFVIVTVRDLCSGGAAVLHLEQDEGGPGDPGDAAGIEASSPTSDFLTGWWKPSPAFS
jgi:hypothetical protein